MTAIVGLVHDGRVYIGADAGATSGWDLRLVKNPKVFNLKNEFVIGYTTSFRMGQLLEHAFDPPHHEEPVGVYEYMVTTWIDAVRKCFKEGGLAKRENEVETAGSFLVGYRGHLFNVGSDYQVLEVIDGFDAVGSGDSTAMGALYAVRNSEMDPIARIQVALLAAERFNAGVHGPFTVAVDHV